MPSSGSSSSAVATRAAGPGFVRRFVSEATVFLLTNLAVYYSVKYLAGLVDPARKKRLAARAKSDKIFERLGRDKVELTEYEAIVAGEVVHPDDIDVSFKDIGGLEPIVDSLRETVIYPLCYPELFEATSGLLSAPKGVLLYGPPGCGKTMLARALAKESGATFMNLHISTLTDKFFGESQRLVNAVFSLAQKLQPTLVFIDEIDAFLRERKSMDHEATSMMKSEFMSLWDGLSSAPRLVIVGASNRPEDIDAAFLRRMPKRFPVALPAADQRRKILQLLLAKVELDPTFDLDALVQRTHGYSGSDLKELCRNAAMRTLRERLRQLKPDVPNFIPGPMRARPLRNADFVPGESTVVDDVHALQLD